MGFVDFLLFPFYVALFYFLFSFQRRRLKDAPLKFYHKYGFWVKVLGSFCITIFYGYLSLGDSTTLYYSEGAHLYRQILKDPGNLEYLLATGKDYPVAMIYNGANRGYFNSESNFLIIKLTAFLSFFSMGRYMIISLFFSMIAFSGIWKLFMFFYSIVPHLHKKIAIAVLFLPTVVFWSSGILKDPICMGMLGWFTHAGYAVFYKKKNIFFNVFVILVSASTLITIKPYILYAYVPLFMLYIIFVNLGTVRNPIVKFAAFILVVAATAIGFAGLSSKLQEEMGMLAMEKLSESVLSQQTNFTNMADRAESSFSLGVEYDGESIGSLLKVAPAAINATLFRPYIWESRKISTLLSSLESLTLMFFFLYVLFKAGPLNFLKSLVREPLIMYCFFFAILFALFVGATTLNFGTLVRYKIPCMPFFLMALILIYDKYAVKKKQPLPEPESDTKL